MPEHNGAAGSRVAAGPGDDGAHHIGRAQESPPAALPERVTPLAVAAVGVALPTDRIPDGHPATRLPARDRGPLGELLLDVA